MRNTFKTLDSALTKFVPASHQENKELSENHPDIKNRPLVCMVRKLTREDNLNIRGLLDTNTRDVDGKAQEVAVNIGSLARYIWENCVVEVKNVLFPTEEFESLKGREKNALFNTDGMDLEIMECVKFIQDISTFTDAEAKKSVPQPTSSPK